ncbi:right-handed parallel beta-helix repeat-containing protein, partial [Emticicia sp. BO119]|uniref:right-handed parallel beta-helix repeat-containing protein n=1 Tax=Emticicia sp. BO119 TaxID=2757768 RepID=UPI0015F0F0D8
MKTFFTNDYRFNFLRIWAQFVCLITGLVISGTVWGQEVKNITRNTTFSTIQAAVNDAATVAGDIIEVGAGTYNENVTISKAITVQGVSAATVIIKAPYNSGNANTVLIGSSVTLKNLTITRDYGSTLEEWYACTVNQGINFNSATNVRLEGLIIKGNRNGIYCANSQNTTIINCTIEDNRTGIQLTHNVSGLVMTNNIIRNNFTHGIGFTFDTALLTATNAKIQNNYIADNWFSQINFQRNIAPTPTNVGDFTGAVLSCNWFGSATVGVNAVSAGEPGYYTEGNPANSQVPSQFGGTNPNAGASDRYIRGTQAEAVGIPSHLPVLEVGTDTKDATGFQPVPSICTPVINLTRNTYFATIQAAIDDAATVNGDVIEVAEGTYNENVTINKEITVQGVSTAAIIKAPYNNGTADAVLIVNNNVTLKNLTITRDYGTTVEEWYACTVNQGINFNSRSNVRLEGLLVKGNRNGIYCANSPNATIINCTIEDNRTGIQFTHNVSGLVMTNNIIRNNFTHGIVFNLDTSPINAANAKIQNNFIAGNWFSQLNFQRNAHPTNAGDYTGASFGCNWFGASTVGINAVSAGEPGYADQSPSQFGGTNPNVSATDRYIMGTQAEAAGVPTHLPVLEEGTDTKDAVGFQPVPSNCTPIVNTTRNTYFATIQAAINDATTIAGDTIEISSGLYNQQVLVNKRLVIKGTGATKPEINFSGTPGLASSRLTAFEVTSPDVTIEGLRFKVDLTKIGSAILASASDIDNLTVKDNDFVPYRSGAYGPSYGLRNAISINYGTYRVNASNPTGLLITGNTVSYDKGADS